MSLAQDGVGFVLGAAAALLIASTAFFVVGGARDPDPAPFAAVPGDAVAGRVALERTGCAACHAIDGIRAAGGRVGPSLTGLRFRRYIAGRLPNTPDNAVRFILDPQGISPGSAMPDLRVVEAEARDMVAYLYTLGGRP
jgi:cytochrome c